MDTVPPPDVEGIILLLTVQEAGNRFKASGFGVSPNLTWTWSRTNRITKRSRQVIENTAAFISLARKVQD
jgi:hypothetical protein